MNNLPYQLSGNIKGGQGLAKFDVGINDGIRMRTTFIIY